MLRIDSHQHFWIYELIRDAWVDETMISIRRDFLPEDFGQTLEKHRFNGCVVVQSNQSEVENEFQLKNAAKYDFIKGVVGWVDLMAVDLEEKLQNYQKLPLMKGFRHVLQGESNRALMLDPKFKKGLNLLERYNFTYDVLIFTDQLKYFVEFLETNPQLPMVLDHIAKPDIKAGNITEWAKDIQKLAKFDNVYCKVSGMVTEAYWSNWKYEDFEPYLAVVFNAFGIDRLMFGSDWPVCNLAGGYDKMLTIVERYTATLNDSEQGKFFGGNAQKFYNL